MIGSAKLLSLGLAHEATGRISPSSWRILALVGVLVLCVLAFIFTAEEAQAQQLPQTQQQPVAATDTEVVEQVSGTSSANISMTKTLPDGTSSIETTSIEASPGGTSPGGTSPVEGPPVDSSSPQVPMSVSQPPVERGSEPVPRQPSPYYAGRSPGSDPAAPTSGASQQLPAGSTPDAVVPVDATPEPEPGSAPGSAAPEPVPGPVLESVASEENAPLSSDTDEAAGPTVPNTGEEQLYLPSSFDDPVSSVVETVGDTPASTFEPLKGETLLQTKVAQDESSIDPALTNLLSLGEVDHAPINDPDEGTGSSPSGPESPLKDTPQPVSPSAPPVGNSFSLSGGSAIGPGGLALLLLCTLVSGVILLRRDGKVLSPVCVLPKPDSALRLPLERPG